MDFSCREASGPGFLVSEATKMPVRKPSAYITASRKNNEKGASFGYRTGRSHAGVHRLGASRRRNRRTFGEHVLSGNCGRSRVTGSAQAAALLCS